MHAPFRIVFAVALCALFGCKSAGYWAADRAKTPTWKTFDIDFPEAADKGTKIKLLRVKGEPHWAEGYQTVSLKDGGGLSLSLFVDHDPNAAKPDEKNIYIYMLSVTYLGAKEEHWNSAVMTRAMTSDKLEKAEDFFQVKIRLATGQWSEMRLFEDSSQ